MWYVVSLLGKLTNMNFDFICKISLEICKMGITFAYELGLKSFLYEKSSTRKVRSELSKYILPVSSKQCVHARYPLFVCPERLLRAGQSLMVTNSNACRWNSYCLCSSHTHTLFPFHSCKSSSTNGLRYTSMSLSGCLEPWMSTNI